MTPNYLRVGNCAVAVLGLAAWSVTFSRGLAQDSQRSPEEILAFLSYGSGRPGGGAATAGLLSCGDIIADRSAARDLASFGSSALPALETALTSIEEQGIWSPHAFQAWLLTQVYAKIDGPRAFPRLQRMLSDPKLKPIWPDLDAAMAVSMDLTSYVQSSSVRTRVFRCAGGGPEPREALDRLILGWEHDNPSELAANLGPEAKNALVTLERSPDWEGVRLGRRNRVVGLGYRLQTTGSWAEPDIGLRGESHDGAAPRDLHPEIEARFRIRPGAGCGSFRVRFEFVAEPPEEGAFLINNPDIGDLLRVMTNCVESSVGQR